MAKRMSNRDRIQRQAMEVTATEKEKEEETAAKKTATKTTKKTTKKTAKKTTKKTAKKKTSSSTTKKSAATAKRLRIVWTVFDDRLKEVASFPYPEKDAADKKAAALTKKSGKDHVVRPNKVEMVD